MTSGNSIAIDAVANSEGEVQALLQALQTLGFTQGVVSKMQVSGYLSIDKLGELKNLAALKFARPSYQPIYRVGAVTSQGDKAMRADVARTTYGVDGTGVKVGVISDSYNNKNGAAAGVSSGDLPAAGVQVILDNPSGGTDEGRGMAEIVHDVAPGAAIAFNTANVGGQAGFAKGIRDLAVAGCKVITDDVLYFAEPFFQDGVIAQAITDVVNNSGVTYFSSAGNDARTSYQNTFSPTSTTISGYLSAHNFSGGDIRQSFLLRGGGRRSVIALQWDDPFFSVSGGAGAQTDMDFLVYINGTYRGDLSSLANNIGGDPLEIIGIRNNGSDVTIELVLVKKSGPDPNLLKWVFFGNGITTTIEYDTKSSTAVGHNNSSRAISVGAAPYFNTPAYNNALSTATIENFSSAGGCPILFTTAGVRINGVTGVTLQKPDITSVDGGNTTFFGNDIENDGFPNFFGTSASAPHAAAVAALMKQKVPSITRDAILSAMETTALDMDDPFTAGFDAGFDFGTGFGFIQADKALQSISTPTVANVIAPQSGTVSQAFSFTVPANTFADPNGDALTVSISGLPAGLSSVGSVISGTPSVSGVSTVTVKATDPGSLSVSTTFSLTVNPAVVAPPVNTPPTVANVIAPQSGTVGVGFSFTIPANTFADPNGDALTVSISGLPAGLSSVGSVISGMPSASGVSTVTVTATDPGSLSVATTFQLTINPASVVVPMGPFSITGVTTASCATVTAGLRTLVFTPQYAGLSGQPISFSVVNEMLPTMASGPYTLSMYTDNPVITLKAMQSGTMGEASFAYNWLAACNGVSPPVNQAPVVANAIPNQVGTVGVGFSFTIPSNTFSDPNGDVLTLSVTGLPAGLSSAGSVISGTPSVSGVSTVTVTATDPGSLAVSTTFQLTINPASVVVSGPFSITGVTTVSCATVTAGLRMLVFTPRYAGLSGQPVSFSVVNEMLPTMAGGPYTLSMYTDNPVITLKATQTGTMGEASFTYNWLAACNAVTITEARLAAPAHEKTALLSVSLYPNPVGEEFAISVQGAQGKTVRIVLTDVNGRSLTNTSVDVTTSDHRESLQIGLQRAGLYLLRVSTDQQAVTLKVIKQ